MGGGKGRGRGQLRVGRCVWWCDQQAAGSARSRAASCSAPAELLAGVRRGPGLARVAASLGARAGTDRAGEEKGGTPGGSGASRR